MLFKLKPGTTKVYTYETYETYAGLTTFSSSRDAAAYWPSDFLCSCKLTVDLFLLCS